MMGYSWALMLIFIMTANRSTAKFLKRWTVPATSGASRGKGWNFTPPYNRGPIFDPYYHALQAFTVSIQ